MATIFDTPRFRAVDSNGNPLPGAKLFFYETNTSNPKNIYHDAFLNDPHTNPVIADAFGMFDIIWLDISSGYYRVKLTNAAGVTQWINDDVGYYSQTVALRSDVTALQSSVALLQTDVETLQNNFVSGSYSGVFTGCTTTPSVNVRYAIAGKVVTLNVNGDVATSNTTAFTITGAPALIRPVTARTAYSSVYAFTNNGVIEYGTVGVCMQSNGTLQFLRNNSPSGFTNTGFKGPNDFVFTYSLT